MPKVTDIKQQVKWQNHYSIFIDGKYVFSLSDTELLNQKISIGDEYNQSKIKQLIEISTTDKAYSRCLNLISRRPRSKWEIENYLKLKKYDKSVVDQVVEKLSNKKYLNDYDFAKAWVANRRLLKKTSKLKLQNELRQKNVENEIIKQVIEEDEGDELQILIELIKVKQSQTRYQDKTKLMQYLARQGFKYEDIKNALNSSNNN